MRKLSRLNRSRREIFTSDNGFALGEHRLRGKQFLSEPTARVPMVIRGPGVPAGNRRRQITGNVDIAPTILRAARARALLKPDGISLLPLAASSRRASNRAILLTHSGRAVGSRP